MIVKTVKHNSKMKKNKIKPAYIVDITSCETAHDVLYKFAEAKQKAGLALTDTELDAIVDENSTVIFVESIPVTVECYKCNKKKLPWYKRFWNWITRKK